MGSNSVLNSQDAVTPPSDADARSPISSPSRNHFGHGPGSVSGHIGEELERITLWDKVKSILVSGRQYQKQLQEVYKNYNIPIELRQSFPEAIEETFMPWADGPPGEVTPCQGYLVENENVERLLVFMIRNVTEKLNALAANDDDTIMRAMHLQNVLDQLTFYSQQDLEIFKSRIQACLNEELRMVALCGASQGDPSFMSGSATELIEQIDEQQKNSISRHITELLNRISSRVDNEDSNLAIIQEAHEFFFLKVENYKQKEAEARIAKSQHHQHIPKNLSMMASAASVNSGGGGGPLNLPHSSPMGAAGLSSMQGWLELPTRPSTSSNPVSTTGPAGHPYHELSNGVHPDHPQSPLQEVLTAEALAHSDVILAAKGIQDSRESVYNSINETVHMMEVLKKHIFVQITEWSSKQQNYALPLTFNSSANYSSTFHSSSGVSTSNNPLTSSTMSGGTTPITCSTNQNSSSTSKEGTSNPPSVTMTVSSSALSAHASTAGDSSSSNNPSGPKQQIPTPMPELLEKELTRGLDKLQFWCESLCDSVLRTKEQARKFIVLHETVPLHASDDESAVFDFLARINFLLKDLVEKTFIIDKQPPQILKKDTKFFTSVKHLVGYKFFNFYSNVANGYTVSLGKVSIELYNDYVAKEIIEEDSESVVPSKFSTAAMLTNNLVGNQTNWLEKDGVTVFKNLCLTKLKRTEKRSTHMNESVMEEKLRFIIHTEYKLVSRADLLVHGLNGTATNVPALIHDDLTFRMFAISLPVVAIVHGSQEAKASAVILWDNKFSNHFAPCRFKVPDSVFWYELADLLNSRFVLGGEVNRLGAEDLRFLCAKLFHNQEIPQNLEDKQNKKLVIKWAQFYRGLVPGKNFTFWEWFYEITELMHDATSGSKCQLFIRELWNKNYIRGFISKDEAKDLLMATQRPGTFLIRFAESEKAAITISWLCYLPGSTNMEVFNLKPFTVKDLQTRSLPDRIRDLHDLVYLYPNLPKDFVFEKYYSSKDALLTTNVDGYVKTDLITDIPLMGERLRISQEGAAQSGSNAVDNAALDDILDMLMSPERDFEFDMGMDFAAPNGP